MNLSSQATSQQSTFDIRKYIFKVLSNWYLFVISLAVAYSYTIFKNKYAVPTYGVYTTVLVKDPNSPEKYLGGLNFFNPEKNLENEIGILKSHYVSKLALEGLDFEVSYFRENRFVSPEIYKDSPFKVTLDNEGAQTYGSAIFLTILSEHDYQLDFGEGKTVRMSFGEWYRDVKNNFKVDLAIENARRYQGQRYFFKINQMNTLVKSYSNRIDVQTRSRSASILWVWLRGPVPQKDADFLNRLVEVYGQISLDEKTQTAINTIRFIDEQLKSVIDSLQAAEENLKDYQDQVDVTDISEKGTTLYTQLQGLTEQVAAQKLNLEYFKYLKEELQSGDFKDLLMPELMDISDPQLKELLNKVVELNRAKRMTYYGLKKSETGDKLSVVGKKEFEERIYREDLGAYLENLISLVERTVKKQSKGIELINLKLKELPARERTLVNLKRRHAFNDKIYSYLLEKRTEAGISQAATIADMKVLDIASLDRSNLLTTNKTKPTSALVFGLIIPMAFIFARDFFNDKIEEKGDVENHTTIPVIGTIGHSSRDTNLPVYDNPKSIISESFRTMRTNMQYMLMGEGCKVIMVSSTVGGEGKTFSAVNLASVLAISNKKTLLIGLDLRKPRLHHVFALENNVGLSSYLVGNNTVDDIITKTPVENLDITISGPVPPNPAELIETEMMTSFINTMKKRYDYIVVDTPPVSMVTDGLLVSKFVDLSIYVIRQDYSRKSALKMLEELKDGKRLKNLCILINDIKTSNKFGYTYGYGYYAYGYGYGNAYGGGYYEDAPEDVKRKWWKKKKA